VRRWRHHSYVAQADDLIGESGRSLWQGRFRVSGRGKCLSLAGEKLTFFTSQEHGQKSYRYWTNACRNCSLKNCGTPGSQRRITRWEHEDVLEALQKRLEENPRAIRTRRETAEHPFGIMKMRMGAPHFLMKTLPKVAAEMALCVRTYNLTRVLNIVGARAARSNQGIGATPPWSRHGDTHELPTIARGEVQDDLSTNSSNRVSGPRWRALAAQVPSFPHDQDPFGPSFAWLVDAAHEQFGRSAVPSGRVCMASALCRRRSRLSHLTRVQRARAYASRFRC
jgi:Transposase DDE domain